MKVTWMEFCWFWVFKSFFEAFEIVFFGVIKLNQNWKCWKKVSINLKKNTTHLTYEYIPDITHLTSFFTLLTSPGIDARSRPTRYICNLSKIDPRWAAKRSSTTQLAGVFASDVRRLWSERRRGIGELCNAVSRIDGKNNRRDWQTSATQLYDMEIGKPKHLPISLFFPSQTGIILNRWCLLWLIWSMTIRENV